MTKLLVLPVLLLVTCCSLVLTARFVCYFPNWSFTPDNIDPNLCTHLVYSFASLNEATFTMVPSDPRTDIRNGWYLQFTGLKAKNAQLKTMIAVGGWSDSQDGTGKYSKLVSSDANIATFVTSVVQLLDTYNFDGLDVDWEYPEGPEDKVGYISLLTSLKAAFAPKGYLLSAAVPVSVYTLNLGYDIPGIDKAVDFINLMGYDEYGPWTPNSADHHAPLYKRTAQSTDDVDSSVTYWLNNGMTASKIVMGIPLYGHSWMLSSAVTAPPAPAWGPAPDEEGALVYSQICNLIRNENWQVVQDPNYLIGPYAFSPDAVNATWVGYDDVAMVTVKSNYILSRGLGGAMVWEITHDDYANTCGDGANPLLTAINKVVVG